MSKCSGQHSPVYIAVLNEICFFRSVITEKKIGNSVVKLKQIVGGNYRIVFMSLIEPVSRQAITFDA